MRKLFTMFATILSLIFVSTSMAQVGVIPEGASMQQIIETENAVAEKIEYELELQKLKNTVKTVMNYAVSIGMFGSGFGTCSGVIIKNTPTESIVLSAKHCIGTVEELYVEGILADSVGISLYDDLAWIKLNQEIPNKYAVSISEFSPKKGDLAITIGYPSFELHIGVGQMHLETDDWQFALINVIPGCSGGGVFNEHAELVGIVWGGISKKGEEDKAKIGIFERHLDVVNFVKKHKLLD